ncbi:MAG: cytochrome b [Mariprofundaceae bacterium]
MLRNSKEKFGWMSIILHWGMALAIFGMFALGIWMVDLEYYDTWYHRAPAVHRSIGMLLLFLLTFRLVWRLINTVPDILGQSWEKFIALWVHRGHYLFMFAVIISGYLITTALGKPVDVFAWFEVPAVLPTDKGRATTAGVIHMYLAWAFMGYVVMHAGAAMKHHLIDKDITLLRMLGINKRTIEKKGE